MLCSPKVFLNKWFQSGAKLFYGGGGYNLLGDVVVAEFYHVQNRQTNSLTLNFIVLSTLSSGSTYSWKGGGLSI